MHMTILEIHNELVDIHLQEAEVRQQTQALEAKATALKERRGLLESALAARDKQANGGTRTAHRTGMAKRGKSGSHKTSATAQLLSFLREHRGRWFSISELRAQPWAPKSLSTTLWMFKKRKEVKARDGKWAVA